MPALLQSLAPTPDLICFTGDAMDQPGDTEPALRAFAELIDACAPRLGWFGVFGNHDADDFQRRAEALPITWLPNTHADIEGLPLRVLGVSEPEDVLDAALNLPQPDQHVDPHLDRDPRFTLALAHFPPQIYPAARLGIPLLLAGHTHGGQIRLGPTNAPHTSCDLPKHLGSGLLRLGSTLCAVSRGLGETVLDIRINCPPQLPLYTLCRGPLPGGPDQHTPPRLRQVIPW